MLKVLNTLYKNYLDDLKKHFMFFLIILNKYVFKIIKYSSVYAGVGVLLYF